MIEKAKEMIKNQIEATKNEAVKEVGNILLEEIEVNKEAQKLIIEGKTTIEGGYKEIENYARKNNRTCIGPVEATKILNKYFKIEGIQERIKVDKHIEEEHQEEVNKNKMDIDIADLLG